MAKGASGPQAPDKSAAKTPEEKAANTAEAKRKADAQKAKEKEKFAEYQKLVVQAEQVKAMTDTEAWRKLQEWMRFEIKEAQGALRSDDKMNDVIRHQQRADAFEDVIVRVKDVVASAEHFAANLPLLANKITTRVKWNADKGAVEITKG